MTDMDYESEPVKYWEYRNIQCALYCLRVPDNSRWIGYAQFADEWVEVLNEDGMDTSDDPAQMQEKVENEVDRRIRKAIEDESNQIDWPFDEPVDPNPGIDPNPNPLDPNPNDEPFDPGPRWYSTIAGVPVVTTGTASIKTTDGSSVLVSLSDLDADDVTDEGLYDA